MAVEKLLSYGLSFAKLCTPSAESTEPSDANIIKKYDNPKPYVCVLEELPTPDPEFRLENISKSNTKSTGLGTPQESEYPKFSEEKLAEFVKYIKEIDLIVSNKGGRLSFEYEIDGNEKNELEKLMIVSKNVNGRRQITIIYTDHETEGKGRLDKISKRTAIHRGVSLSYEGDTSFELIPPKLEGIDAFDKFSKDDFELLDEMLEAVKSKYGGDQSLTH